jgi:hypothetical protein
MDNTFVADTLFALVKEFPSVTFTLRAFEDESGMEVAGISITTWNVDEGDMAEQSVLYLDQCSEREVDLVLAAMRQIAASVMGENQTQEDEE